MPFVLVLLLAVSAFAPATTHTIVSSGFSFSPSAISINAGDTVIFSLASIHNAVEVSQSTWDADGGTALAGGFALGFGGGSVVLTQTGTHYFVCQPHASMGMKGTITVNAVTGVLPGTASAPREFRLQQNFPNPFNPSTRITYQLPVASEVTLTVYNIIGQRVATLLSRDLQSPGARYVDWNAASMPSGMYVYTIEAVGSGSKSLFTETRKMVLLK